MALLCEVVGKKRAVSDGWLSLILKAESRRFKVTLTPRHHYFPGGCETVSCMLQLHPCPVSVGPQRQAGLFF